MQKYPRKKTRAPRRRRTSGPRLGIRQLLVPMDFSGYARQALTSAVPVARHCRAKINFVHVVQPTVVLRNLPDGGLAAPVDTARLVKVAQTHLDDLAAKLIPKNLRGQAIIREGTAAAEVVAAARRCQADLIVLSNTGRSGLRRFVLGSTAERIVRHAPCSVLTVRRSMDETAKRLLALQPPSYRTPLPWRTVLVPLDFSLTSIRALKLAVSLAGLNHARVLLLNVVEPNPYPTGMEATVLVVPDGLARRGAKKQLLQLARRFVPKSLRATVLVGRGRTPNVIVNTAEARSADLIVLSTHGHTGLDRLLLGSTTEQVVRLARCPVFVYRKPRAA